MEAEHEARSGAKTAPPDTESNRFLRNASPSGVVRRPSKRGHLHAKAPLVAQDLRSGRRAKPRREAPERLEDPKCRWTGLV